MLREPRKSFLTRRPSQQPLVPKCLWKVLRKAIALAPQNQSAGEHGQRMSLVTSPPTKWKMESPVRRARPRHERRRPRHQTWHRRASENWARFSAYANAHNEMFRPHKAGAQGSEWQEHWWARRLDFPFSCPEIFLPLEVEADFSRRACASRTESQRKLLLAGLRNERQRFEFAVQEALSMSRGGDQPFVPIRRWDLPIHR